ncbi:NAD(P)H-dependent oxidoreductase [Acinetobacter nectaris]|nr:NAD(P)H-dependent oxidoreductase [Acinetobacter nectaris]
MNNVLVVSGHPDLAESIANVTILDEVKKQLPQVHIRKLDELYPNDLFNIQDEQQALLAADIIV